MGLETKVRDAVYNAGDYIEKRASKIFDELRNDRLRNYFEGVDEQEVRRREGLLEAYVRGSVDKYKENLRGVIRKGVTRGSMLLTVVNQLYALVSKAPLANFSAISYILFGIKSIAEIPALYNYWKKTHDRNGVYGLLKYLLMKPINYAIPFIGPALEAGMFERMVKKRVKYEAENNFLEAIGEKGHVKRMKETMQTTKISDIAEPIAFPAQEELALAA